MRHGEVRGQRRPTLRESSRPSRARTGATDRLAETSVPPCGNCVPKPVASAHSPSPTRCRGVGLLLARNRAGRLNRDAPAHRATLAPKGSRQRGAPRRRRAAREPSMGPVFACRRTISASNRSTFGKNQLQALYGCGLQQKAVASNCRENPTSRAAAFGVAARLLASVANTATLDDKPNAIAQVLLPRHRAAPNLGRAPAVAAPPGALIVRSTRVRDAAPLPPHPPLPLSLQGTS